MSPAVAVHSVVQGSPRAPVLILSHAIGASLAMWDPQAEALSRLLRIVRYDSRGHGSSPVPMGPYAIEELGGDLVALMDRLGVERASICGLSLGAMTALWVAAHAPDRVERLVACCVVARPASTEAWRERAATVRRDGIAAVADLVVERWGYRDRDAAMEAVVRRMLLATPAEGYAASCDAIEKLDLTPDLPSIVAPTLLLVGADDPAAPEADARAIAGLIPDATVRVVKGAAHLANVERPEAVTSAIIDHLAAVQRGGEDERRAV